MKIRTPQQAKIKKYERDKKVKAKFSLDPTQPDADLLPIDEVRALLYEGTKIKPKNLPPAMYRLVQKSLYYYAKNGLIKREEFGF